MQAARIRAVARVIAPTVALLIVAVMVMRCDMAVFSPAAQWDAKEPVSRAERSDGMIALTFDSGWGEDGTRRLLDELAQRGIPATFFLTGYWIDENPEKVRMMHDAGHEIGSHSLTHSRMAGLDGDVIDAELSGVSERLEALTGDVPRMFRPPYGDWDAELLERVRLHGQIAVMWSVDAQSAGGGSLDGAFSSVMPGDIVLMSLCDGRLMEEMGARLDELMQRGFAFGTVSQLIGMGNDPAAQGVKLGATLHAAAV